MNEWSSEEMRRLQDEAKKRVLEMKARSRFAAEDMNKTVGETSSFPDPRFVKAPDVPRAIKMPVELPERKRTFVKEQDEKIKQEAASGHSDTTEKTERKESAPSALIKNIFGNLSDDDLERMFVLSLCLLLSYEHTDDEIILALMYILS